MKKVNIIFYIIGTICFLMAIYIIIDKYFIKDMVNINFNEEEEVELINNKLSEIGSPLGWMVIVDGINNQDDNGNYKITFGEDLFDTYSYRQLFVMEYILSYNNYDLFVVLDTRGNIVDEEPTSELTYAYMNYEDYNEYYKSLFGENFNINEAMKGNTIYSNNNVYYENRRAGSNGVYVSMMQATGVQYNDGVYTADAAMTYSTMASELVGASKDNVVIEYTKDINGNIILKSFTVKDR